MLISETTRNGIQIELQLIKISGKKIYVVQAEEQDGKIYTDNFQCLKDAQAFINTI